MYRALWITFLISQQWSVLAVQTGFMRTSQQTPIDWSRGEASWKEAMNAHEVDNDLWTQPNYCDARVLRSSAPLTVLFGLSTFWPEVKKHRARLGAGSDKPLEIHVPGSAYPFEGRSDWSLLASRKPADIPAVRVVLVLGTPWHQDNVPQMTASKDYDENAGPELTAAAKEAKEMQQGNEEMEEGDEEMEEEEDSFLQLASRKVRKPEVGTIREGGNAIQCKGQAAKDASSFKKSELCRNHGNGLEVVCVEKYYQDASADLPKPDLVVMYSPGFPQLGRRSWDQVLRPLLDSQVPIMVNDVMNSQEVKLAHQDDIYDTTGKFLPVPGGKWKVTTPLIESGEGGLTLGCMKAYEAREVGGWRSPFPIYLGKRGGATTAKSFIVQLFQGRVANAKPWEVPSTSAMQTLKSYVESVDWLRAVGDAEFAGEVKLSFLFPVSTAYEKGMWMLYRDPVKKRLDSLIGQGRAKKSWDPMLQTLGLMDNFKSRQTPWTVTEWVWIMINLNFGEF